MTSSFVSRLTTKHHTLRDFKYYDLCVHLFVVILLISNLVAAKIVLIGGFTVSGALLLFPLTYIFGDIFTEVYGYSGSRRAIWIGFFASALLAVLAKIIVLLPAAPEFQHQAAYATVFDAVPRAVIGSLIAFWAGEFANSYVLAKMKVLTGGKYLWTRTVGSTVVGQAIDTAIVVTVIFAGVNDWATIGKLILNGYVAKVIYEAVMTPFTYLIVNQAEAARGRGRVRREDGLQSLRAAEAGRSGHRGNAAAALAPAASLLYAALHMRTLRFISMAGLAALLTLPAAAQRAATTPVEPAGTKTNSAQSAAAQQAGATSKPAVEKRAPTAQEVEALIQGIKHLVDDSTEGLVPVTHPDGSVSIDLQGRFQNVSIAKINADGSISAECVGSEKEARQFLTTPKPQAATAPKPKPAPKAPEVM